MVCVTFDRAPHGEQALAFGAKMLEISTSKNDSFLISEIVVCV